MSGRKKKKGTQIKFICNPEAGDPKDPTSRLAQVTQMLVDLGFDVRVALAKPKEVAEKIARKAIRKGYRFVVVMGGDGTIEAAARALAGSKTRLGILPGGTENNIVHALGIPDDLEMACQLLKNGHRVKMDVGQIRSKSGKKMIFLELAAVGLLAALFPRGKDLAKGDISAALPVIEKFLEYRMPKITLTLEGENRLEINSLLVTVANTPTFGKAFRIAPQAMLDDGMFDVTVFPDISKVGIAAYFASVSGEGDTSAVKVEHYRARRLTISADPKQPAMADGLMLGSGKVKIKVCRKELRVIAGQAMTDEETAAERYGNISAPVDPLAKEESLKINKQWAGRSELDQRKHKKNA